MLLKLQRAHCRKRAELLSHGDREALLKRDTSSVQGAHYEHADMAEQKLRALRSVEEWVCGSVMPDPQPETAAPKPPRRGQLCAVA